MNRFEFDSVVAEKADAMRRYRRRRSFLNVVRAAEALAAVGLLGFWWLPTAAIPLEMASDWFRKIGAVLDSGLTILVIVNLLIIWIVALSGEKTETEPDLYDEYISAAAAAAAAAGGDGGRDVVDPAPEVGEHFQDKQIIPASQRIDSVEERPQTVDKFAAEPDPVVCCEAVTAVKEMKTYRRTRSERRPEQLRRLEYQRSETASVHGESLSAWRTRSMEGLSNEEFRMTIETFIMEKKRTLLQENDVVQSGVTARKKL